MSEKPPLDFLLHNLRSLVECIEDHYGDAILELIIFVGEEE